MSAPSSPCIRICAIDPAHGLCQGCGRTLREIAEWSRLSESERRAIMAGLAERLDVLRQEPGESDAT